MALGTIKMDKLLNKGSSVYYRVSTDDYYSNDFYVEIDKESQCIKFYKDSFFKQLIYVIGEHNKNEPIKNIIGVHKRALMGAISKSFKIMQMNCFPEKIGHSS